MPTQQNYCLCTYLQTASVNDGVYNLDNILCLCTYLRTASSCCNQHSHHVRIFASAHTYGLHPSFSCHSRTLVFFASAHTYGLHRAELCGLERVGSLPLHIPTDCIMICGITGHRRCLCLCTYLRTASATAHIRQRRKNTLPLHIPTDCITGNRTKRASRELCLCTYLRTASQEDDSVRKIYRFASAHTYGLHPFRS